MMRSTLKVNRLFSCAALATAILWTAPVDATAQTGEGEGAKDYIISAFERAKTWDLSLAEAIPDSAMEWAPTSDVRGFAAQVVHGANNSFISTAMFGEAAPEFGDEADLVADKAALLAAVANAYDHLIGQLREMPAESYGEEVEFFGRTMTRARVGLFALEHAMWTRGQLVPYLHAHGVAVPNAVLF